MYFKITSKEGPKGFRHIGVIMFEEMEMLSKIFRKKNFYLKDRETIPSLLLVYSPYAQKGWGEGWWHKGKARNSTWVSGTQPLQLPLPPPRVHFSMVLDSAAGTQR